MWITQTYLGDVESNAKVFVYYFYADYISSQKNFTSNLQKELEKLGDIFGGKVCLQMPSPRYSGMIEAEVREIKPLWEALHPRLPGLFLSLTPLSQVTGYTEWCFFVPFESENKSGIADAVKRIRLLADQSIAWNYQGNTKPTAPTLFDQMCDAIEIKPGVWGVKLDLKKFFSKYGKL